MNSKNSKMNMPLYQETSREKNCIIIPNNPNPKTQMYNSNRKNKQTEAHLQIRIS